MDSTQTADSARAGEASVSAVLGGIVDDLKTIARDEALLAKQEIGRSMKAAAADAAAILLAGIVALIGVGMLCVAAVVALDAAIDSLAIRLLLMAVVYVAVGAIVAAVFAKRLRHDIKPDLDVAKYEARSTVKTMTEAVRHA